MPLMGAAIASTTLKVGLEIHVELATRTKMWTRVPNVAHPDFYDLPPNSAIDPVVAALPGALPVMNREAVELSIMVGLALGCTIAPRSKWDRKNYYYPDLPKGYQISQYDEPLCYDGSLRIPGAAGPKDIGIIRAHLEEDTGKLGHELPGGGRFEGSLVDLNRAGVPLLEIVTQPDFDDAEDVVTFARELRKICRALGVTEGIMQRGHMRFEPNVNVIIETDDGHRYATPVVEIKNLNSFRAVRGAVDHERQRQVDAWQKDGMVMGPGMKSTRGWDDVRGITVLQREKEDAHDYRYFPDPDLVPVVVDAGWLERIRVRIPELPLARAHRYEHDWALPRKDALTLTDEQALCAFFERAVDALVERSNRAINEGAAARALSKLILNAGAKRANERGIGVESLGISGVQLADIVLLRDADRIGSSAADELFGLLCGTDEPAEAVAGRAGLLQVRDDDALEAWVDAAIAAQPQAAQDFASGKDAAIGRLVGAAMKVSGGRADATDLRDRFIARLRT